MDNKDFLFSQEEVRALDRQEIAREARQEGRWEGLQEGRWEGHQEGIVSGLMLALRGLIETTGMRADDAMTALKIAEADRPKYKALLKDFM